MPRIRVARDELLRLLRSVGNAYGQDTSFLGRLNDEQQRAFKIWCDSWVVYPAERALDALISNGEKIGHAALIESRDSVASQRSRSEVIPHYDRSGQTFPVILPRPLVPSRRGGKTGTESAAGAVRSFEAQVGEAAVPAAGEVPALSTGFSPAVPDPKKKRGD